MNKAAAISGLRARLLEQVIDALLHALRLPSRRRPPELLARLDAVNRADSQYPRTRERIAEPCSAEPNLIHDVEQIAQPRASNDGHDLAVSLVALDLDSGRRERERRQHGYQQQAHARTLLAALGLTLALTSCANRPILRDALIATAIASVAASRHDSHHDGRVTLPPNPPCATHPEQCR